VRLQVWRVTAGVLNIQSRKANRRSPFGWGVGRGAKNSAVKTTYVTKYCRSVSNLDGSFERTEAKENGNKIWHWEELVAVWGTFSDEHPQNY
jgi:hypothetical protein